MFRNLSTSTKLALLCGTFVIAIAIAIYSLVAEKAIAIEFARKELVGTRYLETIRSGYGALLTDEPSRPAERIFAALAAAEVDAEGKLQTAELNQELVAALRHLWVGEPEGGRGGGRFLAALAAAQRLASRVGDDSNLTLDPDLDTYYLQNIVVKGLPAILGHLGESQSLVAAPLATIAAIDDRKVRLLVLGGLIDTALDDLQADLDAGSRLAAGHLKQLLGPKLDAMVGSIRSYLGALDPGGVGEPLQVIALAGADPKFTAAIRSTLELWASTEVELARRLSERIDLLLGRLWFSLLITGAIASISIVIALMTHRHIVKPLERLESVARTVRETGDYSLRTDHRANDELGRLSLAFNDMMSELAVAREREAMDQARAAAVHAELARVARLTTMGEMTASIAHEINQPIAAIVASANAGMRWLGNAVPDLDEARAALKRISADGHRAGQVMKSVRSMFKDSSAKVGIEVNELIGEVLALLQRDLQKHAIEVRTELAAGLPQIMADPVQLQQVLLNLISNAIDAMAAVDDRRGVLKIASSLNEADQVLVTVTDSGTGIDPEHKDRIFEAFFTTKSSGMGMGLSICRSVVQAHGGQLSAAPATPCGSTFSILLPRDGSA
ncbi:MAG: ATP-binding protein [Aestuariivirgaceae bacterium]